MNFTSTSVFLWLAALFLSLFGFLSSTVKAQPASTRGQEFWLGFMHNASTGETADLVVFVSADMDTRATVAIPLQGYSETQPVAANTTVAFILPRDLVMADTSDAILPNGIRVTAEAPVSVFALNRREATTDAAMILPRPALGTDYLLTTHTEDLLLMGSQLQVVAPEDNTVIEIIPSVVTDEGRPAGVPYQVTLNRGEVYQLIAVDKDLSGTRVRLAGDDCNLAQPFALMTGHEGSTVGGCLFADHLFEQQFPLASLGRTFVTAPLGTDRGDMIKITAAVDRTSVEVNGQPYTLDAGNTLELPDIELAQFIRADQPISVAQFSQGSACGSVFESESDPFMIVLTPVDTLLGGRTTVTGMNLTEFSHRVNIITRTDVRGNLRYGGGAIPGNEWTLVPGNPDFSWTRQPMVSGNRTIESPDGFSATVFGYDNNDSYGYAAGGILARPVLDVRFSPDPTAFCAPALIRMEAEVNFPSDPPVWDFGDGSPAQTGYRVLHRYAACGEYEITMTARNTVDGRPLCYRRTLTVLGPPEVAATSLTDFCRTLSDTAHVEISLTDTCSGPAPSLFYGLDGQVEQTGTLSARDTLTITPVNGGSLLSMDSVEVGRCRFPLSGLPLQLRNQVESPELSPVSACEGGGARLEPRLTSRQGNALRLYTQASGGNPIVQRSVPPLQLVTPPLTQDTVFYLESYRSDLPGCESTRLRLPITVQPRPDAPTVQDTALCGPGTITVSVNPGQQSGDHIRLYTREAGTVPEQIDFRQPFTFTLQVSQTQTFWLESVDTVTGCTSGARSTFVVQVEGQLGPGTPPARRVHFCEADTVSFEVAWGQPRGNRLALFTQPQGGQPSATATGNRPQFTYPLTRSTTLYLENQDTNFSCNSPARAPVELVLNPRPLLRAIPDTFRCGPGLLNHEVPSSALVGDVGVYWYAGANDTQPLSVDLSPPFIHTLVVDQTSTFYVETEERTTGCRSRQREPVVVRVEPRPTQPAAEDVVRCGPGPVTLTATTPDSPAPLRMTLYERSVGGNPLAQAAGPVFLLTDQVQVSTTRFLQVRNEATGCVSQPRVPVGITVGPAPTVPAPVSVYRCGAGPVTFTPTAIPEAESFRLFTSTTGGVPLQTVEATDPEFTVEVDASTTLYLEAADRSGTCVSSRRSPVTIQVRPLPAPPVVPRLTRCGPGSVQFAPEQTGSSNELRVYSVASGGQSDTVVYGPSFLFERWVQTTTTYYVERIDDDPLNTCISPRAEARVDIRPLPEPPRVPAVGSCGPGTVTLTAHVNPPQDVAVLLYAQPGTPALERRDQPPYTFSVTVLSVSTYYLETVSQTGACTSATRTATVVAINPPPGAPRAAALERCGVGPVTFSVSMTSPAGTGVRLYTQPMGGQPVAEDSVAPLRLSTEAVRTQTYYLEAWRATAPDCPSPRTPVVARLRLPAPAPPRPQDAVRCGVGRLVFTVFAGETPGDELRVYNTPAESVPLITLPLTPDPGRRYHIVTPEYNRSQTLYVSSWIASSGCESPRIPVEMQVSTRMAISATATEDDGTGNGRITVEAALGIRPYRYALGDGPFVEDPIFADLPAGTYTVRVRDAAACIRTLTVEVPLRNCPAPRAVQVRIEEAEPIVVAWQVDLPAQAWEVRYRLLGGNTWNVLPPVNQTSVTLTGLAPEARYEVEVRGICGRLRSDAARTTFDTPICNAVNFLTFTEVTISSARASWLPMLGAVGYDYNWKPLTMPDWELDERLINTERLMSRLDAATTYVVRLRTICSGGSVISDYIYDSFTTRRVARASNPEEALASAAAIHVYPNPTRGRFELVRSGGSVKERMDLHLLDVTGQEVWSARVQFAADESSQSLSLPPGLASGVYSLQIQSESGWVQPIRILLNR